MGFKENQQFAQLLLEFFVENLDLYKLCEFIFLKAMAGFQIPRNKSRTLPASLVT